MLAFTRGFLAWRKRHPALIRGDIRFLDAPEPVLAFVRGTGEEATGRSSAPSTSATPRSASPRRRRYSSKPLAGHGLPGALDDGAVRLPPHGGLFARVIGGSSPVG